MCKIHRDKAVQITLLIPTDVHALLKTVGDTKLLEMMQFVLPLLDLPIF